MRTNSALRTRAVLVALAAGLALAAAGACEDTFSGPTGTGGGSVVITGAGPYYDCRFNNVGLPCRANAPGCPWNDGTCTGRLECIAGRWSRLYVECPTTSASGVGGGVIGVGGGGVSSSSSNVSSSGNGGVGGITGIGGGF